MAKSEICRGSDGKLLFSLSNATRIESSGTSVYVASMSLAQLKDQAAHLPPVEQRELIAFLIARQTELDEAFKQALAQKIDDADPSHWVELDALRKHDTE